MDTTKYKLIYTNEHGNFYVAIDPNNYHLSRYVAANVQDIYASCGTTPDYMDSITNRMLDIINTSNVDRIKSDLSVLVNNIRYRLKYPVDQDAALRMACCYIIHEDENPDEVNPHWMQKKLEWCKSDGKMYEVFFSHGVTFTPSWKERLSDLGEMTVYLNQRNEALMSLNTQ